MKTSSHIISKDPDEVETILAPALGGFRVTPLDKEYSARICVEVSPRVALFTVAASDSRALLEPPHAFFALGLALSGCFSVTEGRDRTSYGRDIFLGRPDREYAPELRAQGATLVANIFVEPLQADLHKLSGSDALRIPAAGNRIDISSPAGLSLACNIYNLWSAWNRSGASPGSDICTAEQEDELITNFVAATETLAISDHRRDQATVRRAIARAEEYLDANLTNAISRADLAGFAGVSIRTLSRSFLKQYGIGPMAFLRLRRLDAAYRHLLRAEADSTRVTDVAVRYGFNHLGKFATEYKKTFGECPSCTLNR